MTSDTRFMADGGQLHNCSNESAGARSENITIVKGLLENFRLLN